MSDVMLHGVLRLPPDLWRDSAIDIAQRHGRYLEASQRIESDAAEIAGLKTYAATLAAERDAANAARMKLVQERFKLAAEATTHLESLGIGGADDGYSIVGLLIGKVESVMAERDELFAALQHPSYAEESKLRAERDALAKELAEAQMELAALKVQSEPVARVAGYYAGRCVIAPLDPACAFPDGMAADKDAERPTNTEVLKAIGRGWCHESTQHKEMDSLLALAILEEVMIVINGTPRPTLYSAIAKEGKNP